MRTAIILFVVVLAGLLLTACDERESDKPEIEFLSDRYELTNQDDNLNYCTLTVCLSGDDGVTNNEKINFIYDHTAGLLIGSGSNNYAYTDSSGVATAEFTVYDSTSGEVSIEAVMDKFSTVHDRVILSVTDTPTMTITLGEDPIEGDGEVIITVDVTLESDSDNTVNQTVLFDCDLDIAYDSFPTNFDGVCSNQIHATNVEAGVYTLTVSLEEFPYVSKDLYLNLTNP